MKKAFLALAFVSASYGLTLEEAVNTAVFENLSLKQAKEDIKISRYKLKEDFNLWMPQFFSGFYYTKFKETPYTKIPPISNLLPPIEFKQFNREFTTFEAGINYPLFIGFKRLNKIKISKLEVKKSKLSFEEEKSRVIKDVKLAYLDVLSARSVLEIYKAEEKAVEKHLQQAKELLKQGLATKVDVLQAKVRLFKVRTKIKQAKADLKIAKARLNEKLNRPLNEDVEVEDVNVHINQNLNLKKLYEKAIKNRRVFKILELSKKQTSLLAKLNQGNFLPEVITQIKYTDTTQYPYLSPKSNISFSIGVSVEFQGIKPYYAYLKEKQQEMKIKLKIKQIKNQIKLQIKYALEKLNVAKEELTLAKENLNQAKEYYSMVEAQYKNQLTSLTELLDAESYYTSAKLQKKLAYYKLLKAYFELEYAVGGEIK